MSGGVGDRIRSFIARTGWTQKDIASHAGVSRVTVRVALDGQAGPHARKKIEAFLDRSRNVTKRPTQGRVEILPNRYDENPTGNPLPARIIPARHARTP